MATTTAGTAPLSATAVRDLLLAGLTFSSGAVDAQSREDFHRPSRPATSCSSGSGSPMPAARRRCGRLASVLRRRRDPGDAPRAALAGIGRGPARVSLTLGLAWLVQLVFAVVWAAMSGRPDAGWTEALLALSALAMGVQTGAALSLGVTGVFTTAATATVMFLMRDEAEERTAPTGERARFARVLVALVAGAAAGGVLLVHGRAWAPVLPLAATGAVLAAALRDGAESGQPAARIRTRGRALLT